MVVLVAVKQLHVVVLAVLVEQHSLNVQVLHREWKILLLPDALPLIQTFFDPLLCTPERLNHAQLIDKTSVELDTEIVDVVESESDECLLIVLIELTWCLLLVSILEAEHMLD